MKEKRFFSRKNPRISLTIEMSVSSPESKDNAVLANTRDISKDGFFIETGEKLPEKKILNITFYLPDQNEKIDVRGQVVWQSESETGTGFNAGIHIIDIDKKSAGLLGGFFESASYYGWFY